MSIGPGDTLSSDLVPVETLRRSDDQIPVQAEPRNFFLLALYQIGYRIGWIFKTESVIMPAVLDSLGGSAWLRGLLPLLNRVGQSLPPVMLARRLTMMRYKKWSLLTTTLMMGALFLALSTIWSRLDLARAATAPSWLPWLFLAIYAAFFWNYGMNTLALTTIQGKLIRVRRRGWLLMYADTFGSVCAVIAAWFLLGEWLRPGNVEFDRIFGFTAMCFFLCAGTVAWLDEPPDDFDQPPVGLRYHFTETMSVLRTNANFRRLAIVAALFSVSMVLFPHYQALARVRLEMSFDKLMYWVIAQHLGGAICGLIAGPIADRHGNRLVLRCLLLGAAIAPLLAIFLSESAELGKQLYFLVFMLVGITPIAYKTLNNYTLEICGRKDHPRYLSTLGLCAAIPILFSPLIGLGVDLLGFNLIFYAAVGILLVAYLLTFGLHEPRHLKK